MDKVCEFKGFCAIREFKVCTCSTKTCQYCVIKEQKEN